MPTGANAKREAEYRKIETKAAHSHTPPRRSASRRKTRTSRAAPKKK
jgi:hypothetical protein